MKPGVDIFKIYSILSNAIYQVCHPFWTVPSQAIYGEEVGFGFWAPSDHVGSILIVATESAVLVQSSEMP